MKKLIIAAICFTTILCFVADLNYRAAINAAIESEGSDAAITQAMLSHGFDVEVLDVDEPSLAGKIQALFYRDNFHSNDFREPVYVEYFKDGQVLLPTDFCPDTLIVRDAIWLNTAYGYIEQGFDDYGHEELDSLFHVYCDYYEGSFEDQFARLKQLQPKWDSAKIARAIAED